MLHHRNGGTNPKNTIKTFEVSPSDMMYATHIGEKNFTNIR